MRKITTSVADYDGPMINGHPALSVKAVQLWFSDTFTVNPTAEHVAPITQALNHCSLFEAHWRNTPEYKKMRRGNPAALRLRRIHEALATLQKELPVLVDSTRKVFPEAHGEGLVATIALLNSVNLLAPAYEKFHRPGVGREPEAWHRIARNIGPMILQVLKANSIARAGFGKPTSPAVKIMQLALTYLDERHSPEAIVDAMRTPTKRKGK